jgi:hypothetical protein
MAAKSGCSNIRTNSVCSCSRRIGTAIEADNKMPAENVDEIRERLVRKLQRLNKRDESQEAGPQQLRGHAPRDGDPEEGDAGAATPGFRYAAQSNF